MTPKELEALFNKFSNECPLDGFSLIKNKLSKRPDLHAFILLDNLLPNGNKVIYAAKHDLIFLSFEIKKLAKVITEEQILELVYCGVSFDSNYNRLYMFV